MSNRPNQAAVEAAVSKFEEHERLLTEDAKSDIHDRGHILLGYIMMQIKHLTEVAQRIQKDMAEGRMPSVKMSTEAFRDLEPRDVIDGFKQRGPSVYQLTILDYKNAERDL